MDNKKTNQVAIMSLALALGLITPLLARRTYDGVFGPRRHRILHKLNAVHNLLYFVLTLATILVKIYVPTNCWGFRFAQGIIFHVYIFLYELVLGMKAKAIIGNCTVCAELSVGTVLLLFSMSIRSFASVMSLWHAEYAHVEEYGLCVNKFHPKWQDCMNYSRTVLEIFWSALFVVPLYRVVRKSNKAGAVAIVQGERFVHSVRDNADEIGCDRHHPGNGAIRSKSAAAMRHLLVASMIFPFCASLISTALSIYMNLDTDIHPGWASIMHGMQNFVSTLSINLILNMRVAKDEPSHSDECDQVRSGTPQMSSRRRCRDIESTDEWEGAAEWETSQSRKPSFASLDWNHPFPIPSHGGSSDRANTAIHQKAPLSSNPCPPCIP